MKQLKEEKFDNANDFLHYIDPNNATWLESTDAQWVFRGQEDSRWDLQPSFWRDINLKIVERIKNEFGSKTDDLTNIFQSSGYVTNKERRQTVPRLVELVLLKAVEFELLKRFIILADELGFHIPRNPRDIEYSGKDYIQTCLEEGYVFPTEVPLCTTLAQHHGIPTRLLDWTRNPYKAAYFAVDDFNESQSIAVWCLDIGHPNFKNDESPSFEVINCRRSEHAFLHSQDGLFVSFRYGIADALFYDYGKWPNLCEELIKKGNDHERPLLIKVVLEKECIGKLKEMLWRLRISKAHLMPSLDNVAKEILFR